MALVPVSQLLVLHGNECNKLFIGPVVDSDLGPCCMNCHEILYTGIFHGYKTFGLYGKVSVADPGKGNGGVPFSRI